MSDNASEMKFVTDFISFDLGRWDNSVYRRVGYCIEIQVFKSKSTRYLGEPSLDPEDYLPTSLCVDYREISDDKYERRNPNRYVIYTDKVTRDPSGEVRYLRKVLVSIPIEQWRTKHE